MGVLMLSPRQLCIVFLLFLFSLNINSALAQSNLYQMMNNTRHMLCLGDSYTIGESVGEEERFPNQTVKLLYNEGIHFDQPRIIARTGWTTDELINAIHQEDVEGTYDAVTLLIGVNNQYREYNKEAYRKEFKELLATAIKYAAGDNNHVFVVSIPDWGATPFGANDGKGRSPAQIGKEIDEYNAIAKEEALKENVHFIDINPFSKKAATDHSLVANDNLHPSGKMYEGWAELVEKEMSKVYHK
jgi:lysophospholipase L1-like esterase